jgi:predicted dehydrogenase
MRKTYQMGVIGAGARGELFARALACGQGNTAFFGLCDLDADRMEKFCRFCGVEPDRRFTDPAKFLASKELDAVFITVPDFAHCETALAALAAGKHVYLEKPLAPTLSQCQQLLAAARKSDRTFYIGFNMRASPVYQKLKQIADSGVLGRLIHVSAYEQMSVAHGASFMRRWHRREARSGGFLNHKCSHDLDILQWIIGHQHRIARVASFGGTNIFRPENGPAGHGTHCSNCPPAIYRDCPYPLVGGFMFPTSEKEAIVKTQQTDIYGNDLCVYTDDKDVVDNQTLIFEWDHGVRGDFTLQPFQRDGVRSTRIWGEFGLAEHIEDLRDGRGSVIRHIDSRRGSSAEYRFSSRHGGHGGTDSEMLQRFLAAIESGSAGDSGVAEGLAASLLALKADESRHAGKVVEISPAEYGGA